LFEGIAAKDGTAAKTACTYRATPSRWLIFTYMYILKLFTSTFHVEHANGPETRSPHAPARWKA